MQRGFEAFLAVYAGIAARLSRFVDLFILPLYSPSTNQQELLLPLNSANTAGPQTSLPKQC